MSTFLTDFTCLIAASITGLIAIGFGLLAGKLGTINYVLSLISAAIRGPLCGLFLVGLCAPWANTKVSLKMHSTEVEMICLDIFCLITLITFKHKGHLPVFHSPS